MNNFLKITLVFGLASLFTACLSKQDEENLAKVDELIEMTDSSIAALEATDSTTIYVHHDTLFSNLNYLQIHLVDTIERDMLKKLSDYRDIRKAYSAYKSDFTRTLIEARNEKEQLLKLKQDIENDIVDEEKFEKYFELEVGNVRALKESAEKLTVRIKISEEIFSRLAPTVDSLNIATRKKFEQMRNQE
jgi:hypothetical protein